MVRATSSMDMYVQEQAASDSARAEIHIKHTPVVDIMGTTADDSRDVAALGALSEVSVEAERWLWL